MFSLIYPPETAPLMGPSSKSSEIVPLVEPGGIVVGRAARAVVHGGSMFLHPVVHLHVIDRMGRIYLQRRGARKHLYPLRWDTSVGGHVSYGETLEETLYREASEEIGFTAFNPVYLGSYVYENHREKELISMFAAITSHTPVPDGDEVAEGRWWTGEEIAEAAGKDILTPNFELEFARIKDSLAALL